MDHAIHQSGRRFRLRPIRRSDAALIVELRSNLEWARYLHPVQLDVAAQEHWIEEYLARPGDYYFVIEAMATGCAVGTTSAYRVDREQGTAEVGRWIQRIGSRAAVEASYLIYQVGFETLGLREVYGFTMAGNERVVSFHDACGLERRRSETVAEAATGDSAPFVEHVLTRERWKLVRPRLERLLPRASDSFRSAA